MTSKHELIWSNLIRIVKSKEIADKNVFQGKEVKPSKSFHWYLFYWYDDKNEHGHYSVIQLSRAVELFSWKKPKSAKQKQKKSCRLFPGWKFHWIFHEDFSRMLSALPFPQHIPHFYSIHHKKWKSIKWERLVHLHSITSLPPFINKKEKSSGDQKTIVLIVHLTRRKSGKEKWLLEMSRLRRSWKKN